MRMARPIRIIGIDPGLRRTGWGVVEVEGNRLVFMAAARRRPTKPLACGSWRCTAPSSHAGNSAGRGRGRGDLRQQGRASTLKLGQARGIAMLAPASFGVPVAEYAPNLVKKTIVGAGHGDKTQVRMMIRVLLPKADAGSHDAADALAIAITHAHHRTSARSCGRRR